MKRTLKIRGLMALAATVFAAVCGMLAGYWIGRENTLRLTATGLDHDAARIIGESEVFALDAHAALDAMNASRYPYCSDEDMEFLHSLLYHSHLLKEIGRIRDNKIACSTTLGRKHLPSTELPKPDSIGTDGGKVYLDLPVFRLPNAVVIALQAGDSYVIMFPYINSLREPLPANINVIRTARGQPPPPTGGSAQPSWQLLTRDGDFRIGNILYSTRCSSLSIDNICMTASTSVSEALEANRRELKFFIAFGGLIGAFFGFFSSILYRRNHSMEQQLRRAIRKDKLRVAYQPIVDLATKRIVGAEALARWTDEDGFAIGPDVFIKIAEKHEFVGEITRLVVRHALRDFAETLRAHPDFHLSINVAAEDLSDPKFLPMLEQSLDQAAVSAESVAIEITESSTAHYKVAVETIHQLRRRGHSVHIDDFGTGYSSLSYLHDLSVDAIKIDRSFTQSIGTEAVTVAILPQILAMAEALNLQVIVEGIETEQQAEYFVTHSQPILAQGWLFGRPVAADDFHRRLAEDDKNALASACIA
jgi:sensor c-di-GMP phosphodiesterase-like protein